jgi:hypothetical protein
VFGQKNVKTWDCVALGAIVGSIDRVSYMEDKNLGENAL